MAYKYRPSAAARAEFGEKMRAIADFCAAHDITVSTAGDSYYFTVGGVEYRVSNHTVAASNRHAYDDFGNQVRDLYHPDGERRDVVYITAGKTRIIDIYNDICAGYKLDRRGKIKIKQRL